MKHYQTIWHGNVELGKIRFSYGTQHPWRFGFENIYNIDAIVYIGPWWINIWNFKGWWR